MHRKDRKLARLAVERGAVFRAIETELDRIYPARAHGERRAADDHADEYAGDEADLEDEQGDGEEGNVFDQRQPPRRLNKPFIDEGAAEIEEEAAEHEFRHIGQKSRVDQKHERRHGSRG